MGFHFKDHTWTASVLAIVVSIAIAYGAWFDYLDSLARAGELFGGNAIYQPWNIIGHFIPALFMLLFFPKKIEMFVAAFLVSTVVMDTPLWGVERLYLHHGALWNQSGDTKSLSDWIAFYYNPLGSYGIWDKAFPTATIMFFSIVARLGAAIGLIWYQHKLELRLKTPVSLKNMVKRDHSRRI